LWVNNVETKFDRGGGALGKGGGGVLCGSRPHVWVGWVAKRGGVGKTPPPPGGGGPKVQT